MKQYQKDKITKRLQIGKLGGTISHTYNHLWAEIDKINDNIYDIWLALDLPEDKDLYLKAGIEGAFRFASAFKAKYVADQLARLQAGQKDLEEMLAAKGGDLQAFSKAQNARAAAKFCHIVKKASQVKLANFSIWQPPIIKAFSAALVFDKEEGLLISGQAFLELFEQMASARQTEASQRHKAAVEAINAFFGIVPITKEEFERYFAFEKGRAIINPASEKPADYLRLIY